MTQLTIGYCIQKILHKDGPVFIVKYLFIGTVTNQFLFGGVNLSISDSYMSCSDKFYLTNGVKQGGILSPALFNVYMNDLCLSQDQSGIGGSFGDNLINNICYADGLCLIAIHLECNIF